MLEAMQNARLNGADAKNQGRDQHQAHEGNGLGLLGRIKAGSDQGPHQPWCKEASQHSQHAHNQDDQVGDRAG